MEPVSISPREWPRDGSMRETCPPVDMPREKDSRISRCPGHGERVREQGGVAGTPCCSRIRPGVEKGPLSQDTGRR